METMRKVAVCLSIIFGMLISTELCAQDKTGDVVYLKDKSIIRGDIIEVIPDRGIRMKTEDGNEFDCEFSEIEEIDLGVPAVGLAEPMGMYTWEVGAEVFHNKYQEPGVMEEKGLGYGISGSLTYHNKVMIRTEGRFNNWWTDYKGSGTIDNIYDYLFEFRVLGGYDFQISNTFTITPYLGFGYRYLNDDFVYNRESNYYYSPIGLEILPKSKNTWSIGAAFEYDYFWKGRQLTHLADFYSFSSDVVNKQDDGYGLRGSIKLIKMGKKQVYVFEPYIRYWNIENSETVFGLLEGAPYDIWEPKNRTTEIGLAFRVRF